MGYGIWSVDTTFNDFEGLELSTFEKSTYEEHVACETHSHFNNKTTVVVIKLKNDFEIVGTSGCEDPKKFSSKLGRFYALKEALNKLGEFLAFYRAEEKYQRMKQPKPVVAPLTDEQVQHVRKIFHEELILNARQERIIPTRSIPSDAHMIDGLSTMDIKA